MKTTNLKQTSVAKARKWFQFRDQRSRLHLRESAKNSRSFNGFRTSGNCVDLVFFPRKSAFRNFAGIRYANAAANERNLNP